MGSNRIIPINLIEITDDYGEKVPRVAGTRFRVSEIVIMHLRNQPSIEWIVENYDEVLDHAKIHAALAYYYQHQAEIDAEIDGERDFRDGMQLRDLISQAKRRLTEHTQEDNSS